MSKVNLKILIVVCVLIMALAWQGADGKTIYVPADYPTIQEAIDEADDEDEIEVAPGNYPEAINFMGLAIRLYSSGGPDVTTIDGGDAFHVVLCRFGEDANTILEGFTITGGNADGIDYSGKGGGMLNRDGSSPTVIDCNFMANDANYGGGMCNTDGSSPTVINCNFSGNSAVSFGGGMYNDSSNPTVTNCSFSGNSAEWGGGMTNQYSSPTVTNCTFTSNTTVNDGGGMYNYPSSNPTVTNCTFSGNSATDRGGGMYNYSGSPTVTNCKFTGNSADYGGGMSNGQNSNTTVTNCIFHGNDAITNGGGMFNYDNSDPIVTNCILWANVSGQIVGNVFTVNYNCIQGWLGGGTGNINADPNFLDAAGGDFRFISSGSPCVDTGNNSVVTEPNDLAGNPRIVDGNWDSNAIVDMGAYELQSKQIHNITQNTWYERIQTAIDDADNGDQIEVGPDTYYEAINFSGMAIELYSSDGPEVTTIDASGLDASVVTCTSEEGQDTILEGFTLTGGTGTTVGMYKYGGGMYINVGNPTVTNCIFTGNSVSGDGGGMYVYNSSPAVTECEFSGNAAVGYGGGGMFNTAGANPMISNCSFINNGSLLMYDFENIAANQGVDVPAPPSFVNDELVSASDLGIVQGSGVTLLNDPYRDGVVVGATQQMSFQQGIPASTHVAPEFYNYFEFSVAAVDTPVRITSISFSIGHNDADDQTDHAGIIEYRTSVGDLLGSDTFLIPYNLAGTPVNIVPSISLVVDTEPIFFRIRFNEEIYGSSSFTTQLRIDNVGFNVPSRGGAIYNDSSSPTVTSCNFTRNSVSYDGGGMYNVVASPTVSNCTFTGNTAFSGTYGGGGMFNYDNSSPTISNCTFTGNTASSGTYGGGGIFNYINSNPTVTNCTFSGNEANNDGGGMYNWSSSPTVTNCIFSGNKAQGTPHNAGGGMYNYDNSDPTLTNCTFYDNSAEEGGGIYNYDSQTVTNCILWANVNGQIDGNWGTVNYSCLQGTLPPGTGNINADPCFVDANNPDPNLVNLRLLPDSPCIDAADTTAVPSGIFIDLDGNPRGVDAPQMPDTGVSVLGITVDMGAYEFNPCHIPGDNNCDGKVDFEDIAILANNWLVGTEP